MERKKIKQMKREGITNKKKKNETNVQVNVIKV